MNLSAINVRLTAVLLAFALITGDLGKGACAKPSDEAHAESTSKGAYGLRSLAQCTVTNDTCCEVGLAERIVGSVTVLGTGPSSFKITDYNYTWVNRTSAAVAWAYRTEEQYTLWTCTRPVGATFEFYTCPDLVLKFDYTATNGNVPALEISGTRLPGITVTVDSCRPWPRPQACANCSGISLKSIPAIGNSYKGCNGTSSISAVYGGLSTSMRCISRRYSSADVSKVAQIPLLHPEGCVKVPDEVDALGIVRTRG